jgi:tripartite ATP-independent transporter DctP family solute receptor
LDGPVGVRVAKKIEDKLDCIVLGWWFAGIRNTWNSKKPIYNPEDSEGLKIRVIGSSVVLEAFNAFGAQATNMSFGELYSAVQQGVLDGGECDNTDLYVEKFYEVTKYVSNTEHMFLAIALLFSKKQYDKLPPELQSAVLEAGQNSVQIQRKAMEQKTVEALNALKANGLIFNDVNKSSFQELVKDVYNENAERVGGIQLIEQVINQ